MQFVFSPDVTILCGDWVQSSSQLINCYEIVLLRAQPCGFALYQRKAGGKKKKLTRQLDVHNAERVNNITDLVKNGKTPSRVFGTFKR